MTDPARSDTPTWTAFAGGRRIASGAPWEVALAVKAEFGDAGAAAILTFDDATGRQVDFDTRGSADEVVARLKPARMAGRPKLGVVAREVTLLPRHWEWLSKQRGGASVTLRQLVEGARNADTGRDRLRQARERVDRFASAMLGDAPNYEEATRALYRGDGATFHTLIAGWPADLRAHVERLAADAFVEAPE
jgi:uncharacterized protein